MRPPLSRKPFGALSFNLIMFEEYGEKKSTAFRIFTRLGISLAARVLLTFVVSSVMNTPLALFPR
jgi:hypothetical protein